MFGDANDCFLAKIEFVWSKLIGFGTNLCVLKQMTFSECKLPFAFDSKSHVWGRK